MIWLTAVLITSIYGLYQLVDHNHRKVIDKAREDQKQEFEAGKARNNLNDKATIKGRNVR